MQVMYAIFCFLLLTNLVICRLC